MARRIVVEHVDDIDGTSIDAGKGETIAFSVDGIDYEIDLSAKNAAEFRTTLDYYIEHAIRVGGRKHRTAGTVHSGGGTPARRDREHVRAVREWAREQGYEVGVRGRMPTDIVEAYNAAH